MPLSDYAKLARLQTAPIVVFIPLVGALAAGASNPAILVVLSVIGLLTHIFIFVSNEYIDRDIDKHSEALTQKILIKEKIPHGQVLGLASGALISALVLIILIFPQPFLILLYLSSIGFAVLYNLLGKKIAGFEVMLGVWAYVFCVFAYLAVGGVLSTAIYVYSALFLIQMWMACAIDGSIKDAKNDYLQGVHTVATALGVRTEGGRLIIPGSYKMYCMVLNGAYLMIAIFFYHTWSGPGQYLQLITVLVFGFVMLYGQFLMISMSEFERPRILKYILVHQCPTVLVPLVMLASTVGLVTSVILGMFIMVLSGLIVFSLYGSEPPSI